MPLPLRARLIMPAPLTKTQEADVADVTDMTYMFAAATLSVANYNALLNGWNAQTLQSGVNFYGGNSEYTAGAVATARANSISDSWTITDGGSGGSFPCGLRCIL